MEVRWPRSPECELMVFVFTMAGLSRRFSVAGYSKPKYMLPLGSGYVFDSAVSSFRAFFHTARFIFLVNSSPQATSFVHERIKKLGILDYVIYPIDKVTRGQAETLAIGLEREKSDFAFWVFNIDSIRHNFKVIDDIDNCDGYLEVFTGEGDNWSFVLGDSMGIVQRTTEKEPISNLCSNGLYYFKSSHQYLSFYFEYRSDSENSNKELYIAPLYNYFISAGLVIRYEVISALSMSFAGIPSEYENLREEMQL